MGGGGGGGGRVVVGGGGGAPHVMAEDCPGADIIQKKNKRYQYGSFCDVKNHKPTITLTIASGTAKVKP